MTTSRSDDLLVGLIGLILLPLIANRVLRGLRDGRLPIYRTHLSRNENKAKFMALLGLHLLSFVVVATITADLILNLGIREAL
jgi:hypothetical protein